MYQYYHSIQGTLYTTQQTAHRVHCTQHTGYTVHNTQGTLYTAQQGTLYTAHRVHCTQHNRVHCTQHNRVHCTQHTGYTVHSTTGYIVHSTQVHCTRYTVHGTILSLLSQMNTLIYGYIYNIKTCKNTQHGTTLLSLNNQLLMVICNNWSLTIFIMWNVHMTNDGSYINMN